MPFHFGQVFSRALPYQSFLKRYANDDQRQRWQQVYDAVRLTDDQKTLLSTFRRQMNVLCMAGPWCGDCVNGCPIFERIAEASPLIDLRFVNRPQAFDATAPRPLPPALADDDIRTKPLGKILVKWGVLAPERIEKALLTQKEQRDSGLNVRIGDVLEDMGAVSVMDRDRALAAQEGYESLDDADRQVALELSICGAPRVPMLVWLSEEMFECQRFGERTLATYRDKAKGQLSNLMGASCPTGLFAPSGDSLKTNVAEWLTYFERVQWMLLTSPRLMKKHGEV